MLDWAKRNGWEILDCSSPETPASHAYAKAHNGVVVLDPRGKPGHVVVVRLLTKTPNSIESTP